MIKIVFKDEHFAPIIECDVCLREIEDADKANAVWNEKGTLWHVHKKPCDEVLQDQQGFLFWDSLKHHIVYLSGNLHITEEDVASAAKWENV